MHANIWIRKEDEELWKQIPKKSEWLHDHLNTPQAVMTLRTDLSSIGEVTIPPTPVEQSILDSLPIQRASDLPVKLCIHGSNPRFCKHAKNGKPCKS